MEDKARVQHSHRFCMEDRKQAQLTGINDVISFDMEKIILESECGHITIKGTQLKVKRLSVEKHEVDVCGHIDSIVYTDSNSLGKKGESVIGRLFR
ncbi:MAG: sporulation protein YabP [Eubacteriales bacterium]|nr:sporulation protein YabP [Eubacteriales bacterium]